MRDPEHYSEITSRIPLENLVVVGLLILVAWGVFWFFAGQEYHHWRQPHDEDKSNLGGWTPNREKERVY